MPDKSKLAYFVAWAVKNIKDDEKGESVTAPGIPTGYPEPTKLLPEDCIWPPEARST